MHHTIFDYPAAKTFSQGWFTNAAKKISKTSENDKYSWRIQELSCEIHGHFSFFLEINLRSQLM